MSGICGRLASTLIVGALGANPCLSALAQSSLSSPAESPTSGNPERLPKGAESPAAYPPSEAESFGNDLPVLYVTGVEVLRTSIEPQVEIIRATGLAASNGWGYPQLVPTAAGVPADGMLDLELIAASPAQSHDADGFLPLSAVLVLEPGDPYKGVRVRGAENVIELNQIPGSNAKQITTNDCRDCIGKQFIPAGRAQAGGDKILREEDLPRELRLLSTSSGIGRDDQSPNRLSLMLGLDGTVTEAFWE